MYNIYIRGVDITPHPPCQARIMSKASRTTLLSPPPYPPYSSKKSFFFNHSSHRAWSIL